MLTRVTIRNFKRFDEVSVELGNPVVFIGPNNSGKTTALQALALWDLGVRRLREKRGQEERGVTLNRRDLIGLPVPEARLLWRDLLVRHGRRRVRIEVIVEGVSEGSAWELGLSFEHANEESLTCSSKSVAALQAAEERVAFLPPMSGLVANETRLEPGAINVRLGEGRTAEVLRNLCHQVALSGGWESLRERVSSLFGVEIDEPLHLPERGEIQMTYQDRSGIRLDISSAGRGLQQTLLLLAYLTVNRRSVLLIDEPDAHLEILRQRQIYQVLSDTAREHGSQIILASHSEIILNEAADRDVVVAFVGKPHRIDDRGSQVLKSLKEIGFDQYYQAEQTGWVLYLEGSTDLAILRAFADTLEHPTRKVLERPFVHYVENQPRKAQDHFYGLREAKQDLQGFALFDRLTLRLEDRPHLEQTMWRRREIESYLCFPETLLDWAQAQGGPVWRERVQESIARIEGAMETLRKGSPWSPDTKVSDDFLDPLFVAFYSSLGLPNLMRKTDYHILARHVPRELIDPEVGEILDRIFAVSQRAQTAAEP
jgi:ABC-type molybdenum transport system ATPase subunit/photorepair protein PhrA